MSLSHVVGALVGWKREASAHGVIVTLQLGGSEADIQARDYHVVSLALNDRQLRSFARDLQRAANERGLQLWSSRKRAGLLARISSCFSGNMLRFEARRDG